MLRFTDLLEQHISQKIEGTALSVGSWEIDAVTSLIYIKK